ncbi:hypothetical protein [Butyrivibrio proteoclasticus]|uniref:hypothetical protein n=1 Tax=Butyrivibrio proteoclasticus TaxID=43305 RepID=UPI00047EE20A|nr:hypothetical protein [Butyrivibrio proteoclasticus]
MSFDISKVTRFVNKYLYSISDAKQKLDNTKIKVEYPNEFQQHFRIAKLNRAETIEADIQKVFNSSNIAQEIKENMANHNSAISGIKSNEKIDPAYTVADKNTTDPYTNKNRSAYVDPMSTAEALRDLSTSSYLYSSMIQSSLFKSPSLDEDEDEFGNDNPYYPTISNLHKGLMSITAHDEAANIPENAYVADSNSYVQSLLDAYRQYTETVDTSVFGDFFL